MRRSLVERCVLLFPYNRSGAQEWPRTAEEYTVLDMLERRQRRPAILVLATLAGLAAVTAAGYGLSRLSREAVATTAWLYLLVVVPMTLRWGRRVGLAGVLAAGLLISLFIARPYGSPEVSSSGEAERLIVSLAGMLLIVVLIDGINRERSARERLYRREKAARADAEAARQRLTFLAGAGAALATSLDATTTLHNLTRLMVPTIGDYCIIDTVADDGRIERAAVTIGDPALVDLEDEVRGYTLDQAGADDPVLRTLQTGEAELQAELGEGPRGIPIRDARHGEIVRQMAPASRIIVPLAAHGRILGVLQVAVRRERPVYGATDLALVKGLASRAALALDNARLYRQAQEALTARAEFLASVSHDLKTPLTAIKGMAQVGQRRAARAEPLDPAMVASLLATVDTSVKRMEAMIADLLDLTRLQSGRPLELRCTETDLVALAGAIAAEHQRGAVDHEIRVESAEPALVGVWDADRLDRVVSNLLSNAIKYSEGGVVTLSMARESHAEEEWAVLRIQDSGVGIPAEDLPHIFERFHRGANIRGRTHGSGIGLAGAQSIVMQHGGTIAAASKEGHGATFTVRLPLQGTGMKGRMVMCPPPVS